MRANTFRLVTAASLIVCLIAGIAILATGPHNKRHT